jgi:hypothetical protein
MATIKARWSRTIQNKPYEPETFELSVEQVCDTDDDPVASVALLQSDLAKQGDITVRARLAAINGPYDHEIPGPTEPDPLMQ